MEGKKHLFSIVIPTCGRPHFLKLALASLKAQTFTDFQVIVGNNSPDPESIEAVVEEAKDPRFKVVRPAKVLNMVDSFNFAASHASGHYVTVLPDKAMLLPGALAKAHQVLSENPGTDVLNWMSDWYSFKDEDTGWSGHYHSQRDIFAPKEYDTFEELRFRLKYSRPRQGLGRRYFRGQIYYGFFSCSLIEQINSEVGQLFFGTCPDHTSFTLGLIFSKKSVDLGMPLCLMLNTKLSTGNSWTANYKVVYQYLKETVGEDLEGLFKELPIPGLSGSVENYLAYDMIKILDKVKRPKYKKYLNRRNLLIQTLNEVEGKQQNPLQLIRDYGGTSLLRFFTLKKWLTQIQSVKYVFDRSKFSGLGLVFFSPFSPHCADRLASAKSYQPHACSDPLSALSYAHRRYQNLRTLRYE